MTNPRDRARQKAEVEARHARARNESERLLARARDGLSDLRNSAPGSIEDAILRFRTYQRRDPFPEIAPGLLTSGAFCAYIAETGLLFPFDFSVEGIQLASVDLPLMGKAVWWDEHGKKQQLEIVQDTPFVLRPNSIAFVTLKPYLQLPDYIALRFNLRVRNVYRGLLLGTGPLVDPGYQGYLAIPLHNLTNNDYTFVGGERLVAVEFTKLDPESIALRFIDRAERHSSESRQYVNFIVPFPEPRLPQPDAEIEHPITTNLAKAKVDHVESSLPTLSADIRRQNEQIEKWTNRLTAAGVIALIGLTLTIGGIMWEATGEMRAVASREQDIIRQSAAERQSLADSLNRVLGRLRSLEALVCAELRASGKANARTRVLQAVICP